jgi:hypothetical protein
MRLSEEEQMMGTRSKTAAPLTITDIATYSKVATGQQVPITQIALLAKEHPELLMEAQRAREASAVGERLLARERVPITRVAAVAKTHPEVLEEVAKIRESEELAGRMRVAESARLERRATTVESALGTPKMTIKEWAFIGRYAPEQIGEAFAYHKGVEESTVFYKDIGFPQYAGLYAPFAVPSGAKVKTLTEAKEGLAVEFEEVPQELFRIPQRVLPPKGMPLYTPVYAGAIGKPTKLEDILFGMAKDIRAMEQRYPTLPQTKGAGFEIAGAFIGGEMPISEFTGPKLVGYALHTAWLGYGMGGVISPVISPITSKITGGIQTRVSGWLSKSWEESARAGELWEPSLTQRVAMKVTGAAPKGLSTEIVAFPKMVEGEVIGSKTLGISEKWGLRAGVFRPEVYPTKMEAISATWEMAAAPKAAGFGYTYPMAETFVEEAVKAPVGLLPSAFAGILTKAELSAMEKWAVRSMKEQPLSIKGKEPVEAWRDVFVSRGGVTQILREKVEVPVKALGSFVKAVPEPYMAQLGFAKAIGKPLATEIISKASLSLIPKVGETGVQYLFKPATERLKMETKLLPTVKFPVGMMEGIQGKANVMYEKLLEWSALAKVKPPALTIIPKEVAEAGKGWFHIVAKYPTFSLREKLFGHPKLGEKEIIIPEPKYPVLRPTEIAVLAHEFGHHVHASLSETRAGRARLKEIGLHPFLHTYTMTKERYAADVSKALAKTPQARWYSRMALETYLTKGTLPEKRWYKPRGPKLGLKPRVYPTLPREFRPFQHAYAEEEVEARHYPGEALVPTRLKPEIMQAQVQVAAKTVAPTVLQGVSQLGKVLPSSKEMKKLLHVPRFAFKPEYAPRHRVISERLEKTQVSPFITVKPRVSISPIVSSITGPIVTPRIKYAQTYKWPYPTPTLTMPKAPAVPPFPYMRPYTPSDLLGPSKKGYGAWFKRQHPIRTPKSMMRLVRR